MFLVALQIVGAPLVERNLVLDLQQSGYGPEQAYRMLQEMGGDGRRLHWITWAIDWAWCLSYPFFFVLLLRQVRVWAQIRSTWFMVLPLLTGVLDVLENISISIQLTSFPDWSQIIFSISWWTGRVVTPAKWMLAKSSVVMLVALILVAVYRKATRFSRPTSAA